MNTITKLVVLVSLCLIMSKANAQDTIQKTDKSYKIENLQHLKQEITNEEKELLKAEVEIINKRLDNQEITKENADELKKAAAEKRALNIENRIAIIDNQIALLKRNDDEYQPSDGSENNFTISFGNGKKGISIKSDKQPVKYDIRTSSDLLFAIGLNNAIIDGQSLDDSPYQIGGSGFVELGWLWKTRIMQNSNFARVSYGFSFQWNKFSIKDNLYFVEDGDQTILEEFPLDLKKSKFRTTSLVIPVHFEFGPSKKEEKEDRVRYWTDKQFKIGIGGFGGINLSTLQKLKYKEDGDDLKQKTKTDFNTTNFVYGLSGYVGVGDFSIYTKYNLNDLFKNQTVNQHNISLGLRWDFD